MPWRQAVVIGGAIASILLSAALVLTAAAVPVDWAIFAEAADRVRGSGLYDETATYAYRYSPVLAYIFTPLEWLGPDLWRVAHIAAAFALPSWRLRLVTLAAFPLWYDWESGNLVIFLVIVGVWALRGQRWAVMAFLVATLLIPRPLMIPLAAWLLWREPWVRAPFVGAFAIHAIGVNLTGWGDEWISRLVASGSEMASTMNVGPSRVVGYWWLVVGLPLAAWLTMKGRVGLASLAASPYWLPYYGLMLLLDAAHPMNPRLNLRATTRRVTPQADLAYIQSAGRGAN